MSQENPFTNNDNTNNNQPHQEESGTSTSIITIGIVCLLIGLGVGYFVFAGKDTDEDLNIDDDQKEEPATTTTDIASTTDKETESEATSSENTDSRTANTISNSTSVNGMSLKTESQPAGSRVALASLAINQPAWVVTFESTADGTKPNRIIGAQFFRTGNYENVSAFVVEPLKAGATYFTALYKDDGATGGSGQSGVIFNHQTDRPYIQNGQWILSSFKTNS